MNNIQPFYGLAWYRCTIRGRSFAENSGPKPVKSQKPLWKLEGKSMEAARLAPLQTFHPLRNNLFFRCQSIYAKTIAKIDVRAGVQEKPPHILFRQVLNSIAMNKQKPSRQSNHRSLQHRHCGAQSPCPSSYGLSLEQRKRDRLSHGLVPRRPGVQVIARIICWQQL